MTHRALFAVSLAIAVAISVPLADRALAAETVSASHDAAGDTHVSASVNSLILLDIVTPASGQHVDFGEVPAGVTTSAQRVGLVVRSNRRYSLATMLTDAEQIGLTTTLGDSSDNPKTNCSPYDDEYRLTVPHDTAPGRYEARVIYTVVPE